MDILNVVFAFESTRQRQRAAPLLSEREALLRSMLQQGTSVRRLRSIASMLLHVLRILELQTLRVVDLAEVREAGLTWAAQTELRNRNGQSKTPDLYVYVAAKWLRFHRCLREPVLRVEPDDTYVEQLVGYLSMVRGLAPDTVIVCRRRVIAFLQWTRGKQLPLGSVTMNDVDDYLQSKLNAGYLPRSIASVCSALRLFFLFAEKEGWNDNNVALAIQRPRISRCDAKPRGPEWVDVRRMLDHDFGSTTADIRGDAMAAVSAIYGLRNIEMIRLKLGDLDWMNEILTVKRAKSYKIQQFPIQVEVGEKIIRYLKHARPKCACRNLFVSLKPPYRPVDSASLWVVVSRRMKSLGIESQNYGTHALRHTCASRLLHQGSSLTDIAHFLGHSDLKSVSIYAKHDDYALRQVASISLAAIL